METLNSKEIQRKALLDGINSLLKECTTEQVNFFNKLKFKNESIENETLENLTIAYELCRRTVIKNKE